MNKWELQDKFLDNIFDYISDESINDMLNSLPPDDEIDHEFSKNFQKNMNKTLNRDYYRLKRIRMIRVCSRVAVILGFLLIGSSIMVASVEAFRIPFLNFVFSEKEDAVEVCLEEVNTAVEIDKEKYPDLYLPSYVPEGYSYVGTRGKDYSYVSSYMNEDDEVFTIIQTGKNSTTMINSVDSTYKKATKFGIDFFIAETAEDIDIVWEYSGFVCHIVGNLSIEEGMEIMKSIKK